MEAMGAIHGAALLAAWLEKNNEFRDMGQLFVRWAASGRSWSCEPHPSFQMLR